MAAMAAMDPNNQLAMAYGYGINPAMMAGMPGMEMFMGGSKAKTNTTTTPTTSKTSSSPRASPRPPSRASVKSSDDRRSPKTSMAPRTSTPSSTLNNAAAALGIDPKLLAGMDPKLFQAAGLDPKTLASLDPKMLGLDPRTMMGLSGFPDPKVLAGMDPKLLQAAGIDPKMVTGKSNLN